MTKDSFSDAGLCGLITMALVMTGFVVFHAFFAWTPWVALLLGMAVGVLRWRWQKRSPGEDGHALIRVVSMDRWTKIGVGGVFLGQAALLTILCLVRTDHAIASPWQVFPQAAFPLFTLTLFLALLLGESLPRWLAAVVWTGECLLAFGVSLIIYKLGFGFDPFIHQAAARSLLIHGDIQLPSILYVGQYALEAGLGRLLPISIGVIDRLLGPILAIALAVGVLPRAWKQWSGSCSFVPTWSVFLLPFLPFTFTVPYQLTYLGLLVVIFLLPWFATKRGSWLALPFILFMSLVHPLLAIPAAALVFSSWIATRWPRFAGAVAFFLTFSVLMGAFYLYVQRLGGSMIWPTVPFLRVGMQAVLGFPYQTTGWPAYVGTFYRFFHLWPLVFSLLGWYGFRFLRTDRRAFCWILPSTALAVFVAAIGLASSARFANIISMEQFEFALRLRAAAPLFFFPGWVALLERILQKLSPTKKAFFFAFIALFATAIWFLSYPQANFFIQRSSPGLSRSDVLAFEAVERLAEGKPYVALTSQMVSAAALRGFGFERELSTPYGPQYPFTIPTGGALYQQYLRIWSEKNELAVIEQARQLSGQQQVFIVIPRAWDPRGVLFVRLRPLADRYERVDAIMDVYRFR